MTGVISVIHVVSFILTQPVIYYLIMTLSSLCLCVWIIFHPNDHAKLGKCVHLNQWQKLVDLLLILLVNMLWKLCLAVFDKIKTFTQKRDYFLLLCHKANLAFYYAESIVMNVTISIKVSFGWKFVLNNKAHMSVFLKLSLNV